MLKITTDIEWSYMIGIFSLRSSQSSRTGSNMRGLNILLASIFVLIFGFSGNAWAVNVLVNGDFEGGPAGGGWTNNIVTSIGGLTPGAAGGTYFGAVSDSNNSTESTAQTVPSANLPAAGTQLQFSFDYAVRASDASTVRWEVRAGGSSGTVIANGTEADTNGAWLSVGPVAVTAPAAGTDLYVWFEADDRSGVDNVVLDAPQNPPATLCRILRLKSTGITPRLFGTGAFIATENSGSYDITIKTDEGLFNNNGLVYNDGEFPITSPSPCDGPVEQCFPHQNTFSTADPSNLTGLVLGTTSGPAGDTITFIGASGSATGYSYSGKFGTHDGTYTVVDCANAVPVPGTLALLLLPLGGLLLLGMARARG